MLGSASPWLWRSAGLALLSLVCALLALGTMVRHDVPLSELRARYAAAPSRFAQIEGMQVHYRDEGQGHPIVLLHGASSSLQTWDGWAEALKTHRRVVRLDLPGFGLTGPASDRDYAPKRLARVVGKLLDALDIEQTDIAGNSLGGQVALILALDSPRRARRLILIDAAGLSGQTPPPLDRLAQSALGPLFVRWLAPRFMVRNLLEDVYADPSRIGEALIDRYQAMTLRAGNRQALLDRVSRAQGPALDARLKQLRLPTLLQWGAEDRWIPVAVGQRLHSAIAGSELIVYPHAGHIPMEEIPQLTVRDADAFLESTDAEPSLAEDEEQDDTDIPLD